ncbi:spermidine/putrescine ABC transporter substrate-binding protein [Microcella daejeonensis]|uniref:Spermidine/putrescine ABC transporter substrate-binding protein n=1 Tax=Microcella daejeonensis TaxID=2994971 RepID=A0A9E8MKY5_9MICO|nr:spermidine/putrescine ABC transporter substrate-binding protein [Microcella daejeonensis]WAB80972.1 spermidine/putrescine ABC transporter substrate-binding protein [Microcella daejeonensis]WAB83148.1 spermidine/putrescine ABC transporter substrate-binding protein [Microcella daejeonensis]
MNRPLPEDPMIRSLIAQARRAQVSRRTMLAGTGAGATALALAACSTGPGEVTAAEDNSANDPTLNWSNWSFYIDEDEEGGYPTLERFQEETGITVNYNIDVDDNNSYFATVRDQLALGQDIGADTVCLTDWMVSRFIQLGYTQELNKDNIPNASNLVEALQNPAFDPGRVHSLPWQGGFAGIAWNTDQTDELRSVEDLWRPDLAGRVGVLSEMRDTIGLIMLQNGVDITGDFSSDEFMAALDVFREKVDSGQIRNVRGNAYTEDLVSEDTLAAICWSGDITLLNFEAGYEKWKFVIPEAGGTLWNDNFLVPIGSTRKANVEKLIDYYYQPEVAAEVAAWVNYVTPVEGAYEAAIAIDPELAENQLIFPNEETLSQVSVFRGLSAQEENEFQSAFQSVLLGS